MSRLSELNKKINNPELLHVREQFIAERNSIYINYFIVIITIILFISYLK